MGRPTLAEALTRVDAMLRHADLTTSEVEAVAVLRDHARAISPEEAS